MIAVLGRTDDPLLLDCGHSHCPVAATVDMSPSLGRTRDAPSRRICARTAAERGGRAVHVAIGAWRHPQGPRAIRRTAIRQTVLTVSDSSIGVPIAPQVR